MNVELIELSPCKKQLRVKLDVEEVDQAFDRVTGQFRKQANLPGFRKGKAPRDKVEAEFKDKIEEEVKQQLMSDAYRRAMDEKELKPVASPDIEEIEFGRSKALDVVDMVITFILTYSKQFLLQLRVLHAGVDGDKENAGGSHPIS